MGIIVADREHYKSAIQKLFPRGAYWDAQFSDPASDLSLFCEAKLAELVRFLERKSSLHDESMPQSADELIADWERVLLGEVSFGLSLAERRRLLESKQHDALSRPELEKIASRCGLSITEVSFPFRPFFIGHSKFGSYLGSLGFFSTVRIKAIPAQENTEITDSTRTEFEAAVGDKLLANQSALFVYGGL